jgi:hypothetical protein
MKQFCCIAFVLTISCMSCDNNVTTDQDKSTAKITEVENRAINGQQWRVTNYTQSDVDQTSAFAGYIFELDANNLLTVTNGVDNFSGTWSVTSDGKNDNKSEFDDIDFTLNFTNPPAFENLSEDWEISSMTDSKIELRNVHGSTSEVDLLRFERI